jgi:hypothetical protein
MSLARHVARTREKRKVYKVLVGKPEGKQPLKDQEADGRMGSKWILGRLAQNRDQQLAIVNMMNLQVLAP